MIVSSNAFKTHRADHLSERWNRFSWFGTQWVTQQHWLSNDTAAIHQTVGTTLNQLEAVSIAISEPRLNLQRGRWSNATQYYQYVAHETDQE
ncbi:integron gene cassette protein [Ralstonia phage RS138]|uniref:integron gene cassette protein n=1 Tax=Ralstonia phage RS138 TaxID=1483485 RepID=UPI0006BD96DA|nr:integron gene cassette protein [Ralstonia phage RS138]BAS32834.1 integron gene cassette protein [Ralstonia phage RS138]